MVSECDNRVSNIFTEYHKVNKELETDENLTIRLVKYLFHQKLQTQNTISHRVKWYRDSETQTFKNLLDLVNDLLKEHSCEFVQLLNQLTYNEQNIGAVYNDIVKDVLQGDRKGITWARIGVLFAFSVFMAKSCLPMSSPQFLDNFGTTVGIILDEYAGTWIRQQGGWEHLNAAAGKSWSDTLVNCLGLGTTLLGAAVTIFGYGLTTSAFTSILKRN